MSTGPAAAKGARSYAGGCRQQRCDCYLAPRILALGLTLTRDTQGGVDLGFTRTAHSG